MLNKFPKFKQFLLKAKSLLGKIRKRHIKRTIIITSTVSFLIGILAGTYDSFSNKDVTVTGTLFAKTYSTGKHSTSYQAHYELNYKGVKRTEVINYYESVWEDLEVNRDTRTFTVSEEQFQSGWRQFLSSLSAFIFCVGLIIGTGIAIVKWWSDDSESVW